MKNIGIGLKKPYRSSSIFKQTFRFSIGLTNDSHNDERSYTCLEITVITMTWQHNKPFSLMTLWSIEIAECLLYRKLGSMRKTNMRSKSQTWQVTQTKPIFRRDSVWKLGDCLFNKQSFCRRTSVHQHVAVKMRWSTVRKEVSNNHHVLLFLVYALWR